MAPAEELTPQPPFVVAERAGDDKSGLAAYDPIQQLALTRYARFAMLARDVVPLLDPTDWRARLVHKALYSAYRDCEDCGVGHEVHLLRERGQVERS